MELERVDFQRDVCPPGKGGATASITDLQRDPHNYAMRFADGLVSITDRSTGKSALVPVHNVARMVPREEPEKPAKGKR